MNHLETIRQLGGNKFVAMVGATFLKDGNTLIVKFKGSKVANIMYISLNSMDLYDVKIGKFKGMDLKVISEVHNLYDDMLQSHFTKVTGLHTTL